MNQPSQKPPKVRMSRPRPVGGEGENMRDVYVDGKLFGTVFGIEVVRGRPDWYRWAPEHGDQSWVYGRDCLTLAEAREVIAQQFADKRAAEDS